MRRTRACVVVGALAIAASARAQPPGATPPIDPKQSVVAALAPAPADNALQAVPIGPNGEVYRPDGKGSWTRTDRFTTSDRVTSVGLAGNAIVASAGGAVYKLAPNGWSALRLVQRGKAITSAGPSVVAAVGRQLFALDRMERGEPAKLAVATDEVLAIGSGKTVIVATAKGLSRADAKGKLAPIPGAPKRVAKLVADIWAVTEKAAIDLRTKKSIAWPPHTVLEAVAIGPDNSLVAVAKVGKLFELVVVRGGKLEREPLSPLSPPGDFVGVVVDRAGRAVIALRDGRLLVRDKAGWKDAAVSTAPGAEKPGPAPAPTR